MPHVYSPTLSALTHLLSRLSLLFLSTGLMITSAVLYHVLHFFHITIDIRNVCVFLAPLFSSFTAIVTYHFTKELKVKHMLCTCKVSHYKSCSSRWGGRCCGLARAGSQMSFLMGPSAGFRCWTGVLSNHGMFMTYVMTIDLPPL